MIIYGKQVCLYALEHYSSKIEKIYVTKTSLLPKKVLKELGSKIKVIQNQWAQKLSKSGNHQGILVDMSEPCSRKHYQILKISPFGLILGLGLARIGWVIIREPNYLEPFFIGSWEVRFQVLLFLG